MNERAPVTANVVCQRSRTPAVGMHKRTQEILTRALHQGGTSLLVCLLALFPLLNLNRNFNNDWFNHLWMIELTGQRISHNLRVPDILSTPQLVGSPNLLFYASKFYAVLGSASIWLGSSVTFRLFALLILLLQFWHTWRAARLFCPWSWVCWLPAVAITWATYPLVNLYERSDLTEFTASVFLISAISTLLVFLVRTAREQPDPYGCVATGLMFAFSALTNPLVGLYGGVLLGAIGIAGLIVIRRWAILWFGVANLSLVSVVLAPWLFVVLKFGRLTYISNPDTNAGSFQGLYVSDPLAALISTLQPVSTGPSIIVSGFETLPLRIPLSLPMLVLSLGLLMLWRKFPRKPDPSHVLLSTLLAVAFVSFGMHLLVYCSPGCSALLGGVFDLMQYQFRLIGYVDASLLVSSWCLLGLINWEKLRLGCHSYAALNITTFAAYVLAAGALTTKLLFVQSPSFIAKTNDDIERQFSRGEFNKTPHWHPGIFDVDQAMAAKIPATWYWGRDYDVDTLFGNTASEWNRATIQHSPFVVNFGDGMVQPLEINAREATELTTNVSPFPWNVIRLDGHLVEPMQMNAVVDAPTTSRIRPEVLRIHVPPGRHVLSYAFIPDQPWPFLRDVSWVVFLLWIASWLTVICHWVMLRFRESPRPALTAKGIRGMVKR